MAPKRRSARTLEELVDLVQEATSYDRNVVRQILGEVEKAGGRIDTGKEIKEEPMPGDAPAPVPPAADAG